MDKDFLERFGGVPDGSQPEFNLQQKVAVRAHHPEVQKELSHQVELLKSEKVSEISDLLERIGQLSFAKVSHEEDRNTSSRPFFKSFSERRLDRGQ